MTPPRPLPRAALPPRRQALPLALLLAGLLGGCGDTPPSVAPHPPPAGKGRWNVPAAAPAEQARFALERLTRGPLVQSVLVIPNQHDATMRGAKRDLLALPTETLALLTDPALVARLTGPQALDLNPWHNVLEVLSALPTPPADLVVRWTAPALDRDDVGLWLRAVGCLGEVQGPEVGPLLLRLLRLGAADRSVGREAMRALARLGPPWSGRALDEVYRRGSPFAWIVAAEALESSRSPEEPLPRAASDALAWWALLAEQAGPRPVTGTPRVRTLPYTEIPQQRLRRLGSLTEVLAPTSEALDDRGWISADPTTVCTLSVLDLVGTGQEPAAIARCALARAGHLPARAAVTLDRASSDALRRERAAHCMLEGEQGVDPAVLLAETEAFLAALAATPPPALDLDRVAQAMRRLPPANQPEGRALLRRVLREARPMADLLLYLEAAHDALRAAETGEDEQAVRDLLASGSPQERGLGLHLAQRSRKGVYLPDLERLLASAAPEQGRALMRSMQHIASGGDVTPMQLEAHARRYAAWVAGLPDPELAVQASGLLDLGETGERALVEALAHGARAPLYVDALLEGERVLPRAVAEALCDRLDARLDPEARQRLYLVLWRHAPAEAAGALAAAKGRLDPTERPIVDMLLEVVRHRAAR